MNTVLSRRSARKQAFLALFQSDLNARPVDDIIQAWLSYRGTLDEYAITVVRGVENDREALDAILEEVAEGWAVHRMSTVDRTILRLALYEMLNVDDVPTEVAMNEAVELAVGFSSEESPAFVGGVLRGAAELQRGKVEHG
ncbi:MAG: transcription antitermination factor NusB [Actinomycetota bacterium]|nr:transcription antitermination factor NusB [Actinomycetota bacterium]